MDLNEIRTKIDAVDAQLLTLFEQRMALAHAVADYKTANNLPILNSQREQEILDRVKAQAQPAVAEYAATLFRTLFDLSRAYQDSCMR